MNNTLSGLPRLSREYNKGYTKAIKDIVEVFEDVNYDLKIHKMKMNYSWTEKVLRCCLENRDKLRDDRSGFIRTEISKSGKRDIVRWFDGMD